MWLLKSHKREQHFLVTKGSFCCLLLPQWFWKKFSAWILRTDNVGEKSGVNSTIYYLKLQNIFDRIEILNVNHSTIHSVTYWKYISNFHGSVPLRIYQLSMLIKTSFCKQFFPKPLMFDTIWWCCTIAWINKYRTLLRCWKSHRNFPQLDHVDHVCIIYQLLSSANKWRILIVWGKSGTVSEILISRGSLNQQGGGMGTILLTINFIIMLTVEIVFQSFFLVY